MANEKRDKRIAATVAKLMKVINKSGLKISELLVLYGNLGYHIGASIAGIRDNGPTLEEVKRAYYEDPTVDAGLMLQGLIITDWEKDYLKHPKLSKLAKSKKEEE